MLYNIETNTFKTLFIIETREKILVELKEIDSESIIFWINGLPFLEFKETNEITYKGENILNLRPDIDNKTLLRYISAFYRHFQAENFVQIIKESAASQIYRLSQKSNKSAIVGQNNVSSPTRNIEPNLVPFNLDKARELGAFQKPNTIKILAYLVLAEKYSKDRIPIDLTEANIFFKNSFKGEKKEVFNKCCIYHNFDPEEILLNYSNTIKSINYYALYNDPKNKTKNVTINMILDTFSRLTQ